MADMILTDAQLRFLAGARRAILVTTDASGRPRPVPVCLVVVGGRDRAVVYSPLDEKPKRDPDPHRLARVRDIAARPDVALLVDRWDEDWARLAWLRCHATASLLEPDDAAVLDEGTIAIAALRAKYPQYGEHRLEARPLIRFELTGATSWGDL